MAAEANTQNKDLGIDLRFAMNEFADIPFDEFIQTHGGVHQANKKGMRQVFYGSEESAPDSVDWRTKDGVLNGVQNQGQCGSCWAFSTIGSLESRWALKSGNLLKLSEQQLVDCDKKQDQGCNGGLMDNAFTYLEGAGSELESDYSYAGSDGTCKYKKSLAKVTPKSFVDVHPSDDALAEAVSQGPVSIAVDANMWWQLYFGGVLSYNRCSGTQLNHGVVCVGYNNASSYWIVRNSWGPSWGEKGYIRLQKGKNTCGLLNSAS